MICPVSKFNPLTSRASNKVGITFAYEGEVAIATLPEGQEARGWTTSTELSVFVVPEHAESATHGYAGELPLSLLSEHAFCRGLVATGETPLAQTLESTLCIGRAPPAELFVAINPEHVVNAISNAQGELELAVDLISEHSFTANWAYQGELSVGLTTEHELTAKWAYPGELSLALELQSDDLQGFECIGELQLSQILESSVLFSWSYSGELIKSLQPQCVVVTNKPQTWIYSGKISTALTPEYDLRFSLAYCIQYITFNPRPDSPRSFSRGYASQNLIRLEPERPIPGFSLAAGTEFKVILGPLHKMCATWNYAGVCDFSLAIPTIYTADGELAIGFDQQHEVRLIPSYAESMMVDLTPDSKTGFSLTTPISRYVTFVPKPESPVCFSRIYKSQNKIILRPEWPIPGFSLSVEAPLAMAFTIRHRMAASLGYPGELGPVFAPESSYKLELDFVYGGELSLAFDQESINALSHAYGYQGELISALLSECLEAHTRCFRGRLIPNIAPQSAVNPCFVIRGALRTYLKPEHAFARGWVHLPYVWSCLFSLSQSASCIYSLQAGLADLTIGVIPVSVSSWTWRYSGEIDLAIAHEHHFALGWFHPGDIPVALLTEHIASQGWKPGSELVLAFDQEYATLRAWGYPGQIVQIIGPQAASDYRRMWLYVKGMIIPVKMFGDLTEHGVITGRLIDVTPIGVLVDTSPTGALVAELRRTTLIPTN